MTKQRATTASPPSATQVATSTGSFDELTAVNNTLYWVESRPGWEGRRRLIGWPPGRPAYQITGDDVDVGGDIHAYGGGAYAVTATHAWYVNSGDGHIWRTGSNRPLTSSPAAYGDLNITGQRLLCVRETTAPVAGDELLSIDVLSREERVLLRTDGFLAAPQQHDGLLAWMQWDPDKMPWDASEVWVAAAATTIEQPVRVAGGPDESALQPQWGPDGNLYFMSDRTGWWNLHRVRGGEVEPVAPIRAECAAAPWELGYRSYTFLPGSRIGIILQDGPRHRLVVVEPDGKLTGIKLPFTSIKPYLGSLGADLGLIASSPEEPQQVITVTTDGQHRVQLVESGSGAAWQTGDVSVPEVMTVASGDTEITALVYPPLGVSEPRPAPTIVRPHPGPTHHSNLRLDWDVQFFTSRGFMVVDVDYRGSTGYGRAFRKALDGHWGVYDVLDCQAVAEHLITAGRAAGGSVFISGASAGGYTALRAVCVDGPFAAAVARSAIIEPLRWTETAPRFQQPHAAILGHGSARVVPSSVRKPVLLVHGTNDRVAPAEDALRLAHALQSRTQPLDLLMLDGVGHSLSTVEARAVALDAELALYRRLLSSLQVG